MLSKICAPLGALALLAAAAPAPAVWFQDDTESSAEKGPPTLDAVVTRYYATRDEVMKRLDAVESAEEKLAIYEGLPWKAFVDEFRAVGYANAGSDTAAEAFVWMVRIGKDYVVDDAREAVELLLVAHPESDVLTQLVNELAYPGALGAEFAETAMRQIREESPNRSVQAAAQYGLANVLMTNEERRGEARALLVALKKDFPGVGQYERNAERALFELDNLQIGMVAPDFETTDSDGNPFKLSDYRGKVVILDFWGFW